MGNTNKLKIYLAEKFMDSFATDNIWVFVGKPDDWNTGGTVALGHKEYTTDTLLTDIENWDDIMSIQRVSDVSLVVPYVTIDASDSFIEYTDNDDLFDDPSTDIFYGVVESTRNVYKCISNNYNSPVVDIPDLRQTNVIKSSGDGYIWKFMYQISASDWDKYRIAPGSSIGGWIPIKNITKADDSAQWDDVMKGAVDGEIVHVDTIATTGFKDISGNPFTDKLGHTIHINKDLTGEGFGTGFAATIAQHSVGEKNFYINITNPGSGYRVISTIHTFDGSQYDSLNLAAQLRPILSPIGGHGFDAVEELGGSRVMISVNLNETMVDFISQNDFRKIGLIVDPYTEKSSLDYISGELLVSGNKYNESVNAKQLVKFKVSQTQWINEGVTPANIIDKIFTLYIDATETATKGRVVEVEPDGETYTLNLLTTQGKFDAKATGSIAIRGVLDGGSADSHLSVNEITQEKLKKYTGRIIYVDNITATARDASTQTLKLVLEF